MPPDNQNKLIDEWVAERNKQIGQVTVPHVGEYPVTYDIYGSQVNEWITTDLIRHYADAMGDRNPLWRNQDYAQNTIWGSIIAPPTFTDCILQPFKTDPRNFDPAEQDKIKQFHSFRSGPRGSRRELYRPIRPGDRFRAEQVYQGIKEMPLPGSGEGRYFEQSYRRLHINQDNEVAAIVECRFSVNINTSPASPATGKWAKHLMTESEHEAVEKGYRENKRRGSQTLYWDDVSVGETIGPLTVGPFNPWDVAAYLSAVAGHAAAFDIEWERLKLTERPSYFDPEVNAMVCPGVHHLGDIGGRRPVGFPHQLEGLIGRMICDWMGDDGVLKILDCRAPDEPGLWQLLRQKGTVTRKYSENNEHLVDIDVVSENTDGQFLTGGFATVRLPPRQNQ